MCIGKPSGGFDFTDTSELNIVPSSTKKIYHTLIWPLELNLFFPCVNLYDVWQKAILFVYFFMLLVYCEQGKGR